MFKKQVHLAGWGNYPRVETDLIRPERVTAAVSFFRETRDSIIPRGAGRSYGDASLNKKNVLTTERLDHFIAFDKEKGILKCQAGVTLHDVLEVITPCGWFLPVLPGTQWATVGGSFACNVHGKNHFQEGDFAEHVRSILLILPTGEMVTCSPVINKELFFASAGGMGMTGMILELDLQLVRISSPFLTVKRDRISGLQMLSDALRKNTSEYWVAWIDHFSQGNQLGRGIVETASHAQNAPLAPPLEKRTHPPLPPFGKGWLGGISIPRFWPKGVLNRWSIQLYNRLRLHCSAKKSEELLSWQQFFNPLDHIQHWNRLYGRPGFLQYQCTIGEGKNTFDHLAELLTISQKKDIFSYLVVVKSHRDSKGLLGFPIAGISVAMDFPYQPKLFDLLNTFDALITQWGGRVYLAKDARLSAKTFQQMYAHALPAWLAILKEIDPHRRMESEMSHRLEFKKW